MLNKIRNSLFAILVMIIISPAFTSAEMVKLAEVNVSNFSVDKSVDGNLKFTFNVKNKSTAIERELKYAVALKDKSNKLIEKRVFDNDTFSLNPQEVAIKKVDYQYNKNDVIGFINLYILNKNGSTIGVASLNNLNIKFDSDNQEEVINSNEYSCSVQEVANKEGKNEKVILCNVEGDNKILTEARLGIYQRNTFGKKILDKKITGKVNDKKIIFELPEVNPGYYEAKMDIDNQEILFKIRVEGFFGKIDNLSLEDKTNFIDGDTGTLNILISANQENLSLSYGIVNGNNEVCSNDEIPVKSGALKSIFIINRECKDAKVYGFLIDGGGKILDSYNVSGKKPEYFEEQDKSNSGLEITKYSEYILYFALAIFLVALVLFFLNKKTLSISLIIISIILSLTVFGYNKIFAQGSYQVYVNSYISNFQPSYAINSPVTFTIFVENPDSVLPKNNDVKISVKIDDGGYQEQISYSDTESFYNISLGALTEGEHTIKVKIDTKAIFDVSEFSISKFGVNSEYDSTIINVDGEMCVPDWQPSPTKDCDPFQFEQTDVNACVGSEPRIINGDVQELGKWTPARDGICEGVIFTQTEPECGMTRKVEGTVDCGEDWCLTYPDVDECNGCVIDWEPSLDDYCEGVDVPQKNTCTEEWRYEKGIKPTSHPDCNLAECTLTDPDFENSSSWTDGHLEYNVDKSPKDSITIPNIELPSNYCSGEQFMQVSSCGDTRVAEGTSPLSPPNCMTNEWGDLYFSTDGGQMWHIYTGERITILKGRSKLRLTTDPLKDKITSWSMSPITDGLGLINSNLPGNEEVELDFNTTDPDNKMYSINVRAMGAMIGFTEVKLKIVGLSQREI